MKTVDLWDNVNALLHARRWKPAYEWLGALLQRDDNRDELLAPEQYGMPKSHPIYDDMRALIRIINARARHLQQRRR